MKAISMTNGDSATYLLEIGAVMQDCEDYPITTTHAQALVAHITEKLGSVHNLNKPPSAVGLFISGDTTSEFVELIPSVVNSSLLSAVFPSKDTVMSQTTSELLHTLPSVVHNSIPTNFDYDEVTSEFPLSHAISGISFRGSSIRFRYNLSCQHDFD